MIEIERKFLVLGNSFKEQANSSKKIVQGYLNSNPERTVRIRIKGDYGYITVKGKSNASGTSRLEWEKEITPTDAEMLLELCEKGSIEKIRYEVPYGNHIFEVDEFYGENDGLIVAEIELADENESFLKPDWLGKEVTGDERYYNAYLSLNPYAEWRK